MLANKPFVIVHDGKGIMLLFVDGKVHGDWITRISLEHKGGELPSVEITADDVTLGSSENKDIFAFREMIDRIIENAPCK